GGTSSSVATFTVAATAITSMSPATGAAGTTVNVTLSGANFTSSSTVAAGAGVTVSSVAQDSVDPTGTLTATFTIAGNAATGTRCVTVTVAGGASPCATFTILGEVPTSVDIMIT